MHQHQGVINMAKYFPCKIYNTDSPSGDEPAFAILSMTPGFGLEDAKIKIDSSPPNNVFILVNGQQTLADKHTDDTADDCFGRALCGIDRIAEGKSGKWKGKFKIHTGDSGVAYTSVASTLFNDYGSQDLIIDIANAKYDWSNTLTENKRTFDKFCATLQQLLERIQDRTSLRFFIAGFSRGGIFSLNLAKWLKQCGYGREIIVVTIDPVIKPGERKEWVVNWADWKSRPLVKNRKWEIGKIHAGSYKYQFPILKAPGDKHYNVFERDGLGIPQLVLAMLGLTPFVPFPAIAPLVPAVAPLAPVAPPLLATYFGINLGNQIDYPIGAAINGAIAPGYELTGQRSAYADEKYRKLPLKTPYDQFDIEITEHTSMPSKYMAWVIDIVRKHFPVPTVQFNKVCANPGEQVTITFQPALEDTSTVSVLVGDAAVSLKWENSKIAAFLIPNDAESGDVLIHTTFYGKSTATGFLVTPFIRSLARKYVTAGDRNVIYGQFHKDDVISMNGVIILPHAFYDGFMFSIPENTSSEVKEVFVLSEHAYESNIVEMIVCDRFDLQAVCVPERIMYYRPGRVRLMSAELQPEDSVLLNGEIVQSQKFHANGESKFIEFTAQCVAGLNEVRVLRLKNDVCSVSNSFALVSCDLTGNTNTMELHYHNCVWVTKMLSSHKVLLCSSIDDPGNNGYDNCHWCLGGSRR